MRFLVIFFIFLGCGNSNPVIPDDPIKDIESQILVEINNLRSTSGMCKARLLSDPTKIVQALDIWGPTHSVLHDEKLSQIADLFAQDLLIYGSNIPHVSHDGSTFWDRIKVIEPISRWEGNAENVTIFYEPDINKVAKTAVENWKNSPDGHCQAQWSDRWLYVGVAVATRPEIGHWIAVTVYGRPIGGRKF